VVDSPVDLPSSSGLRLGPDSSAAITQTFNGDDETPWAMSPGDRTPTLGSVLDFGELGAFKLEARLGRGGMGEVYRARQVGAKGFSQMVAIKRLRSGRREWEERSFVDEARVLSLLHHDNIARVYGFFEQDGAAYLVMEYIEGQTLYALLEQARRRGTRFSERAACLIAADVAEALHYAHHATDEAGRPLHLVHRDVSTTNILISHSGRTKLVDFGVAYSKLEGRAKTSGSSTVIKGKAPYLSPEQVNHRPLDGRSDLFSLGTVLVEMVTGEAPFGWAADHATLKRIAEVTPEFVAAATASASKGLRAICQKLLRRDPADRFANGQELAHALRDHAGRYDGRSQVQVEVAKVQGLISSATPALRELQRSRRSLTLGGAVALLILALLSWRSCRSDRTTMPMPHPDTIPAIPTHPLPEAQPFPSNSCWKALALAQVITIAACQAHVPKGPTGEQMCSSGANREVLGPQGMTELPDQVYVKFVSFKGQVCEGEPTDFAEKPGASGELVPTGEQHEPCPYGDGPIVARISWEDPRADVFSEGIGPHMYERPLLFGQAHVVPVSSGMLMGEPLEEPGRSEDEMRVGLARMTVLFTYIQVWNGNKYPICGVLYWQDGKEGIPILAEQYYGKRAAADWGNLTYVQFYFP
jgi:serine/threonine protein kinase